MKYKITLTENQARVTQNALEEYFRLRLGQEQDFADSLAFMGVDLDRDNPEYDRIFERCICKRDSISEIMKAVFSILWPPYRTPKEKTEDMLIAETVWDHIRYARGVSRWGEPLHYGSGDPPEIEKVEEG